MSQPSLPDVQPAKPRFVGIDIVKILACFLVVSVHFFLYTGFYYEPITDQFGQLQIYLRWIAYCCVPLFMIVTGYLMKNKTVSKKYYLGILRVAILYIVISIICLIFNHHHFLRDYTAWDIFKGFLSYTNAQYAWYVEYYFTIFLIIPYINLAYNGLKTQKQRAAMVIIVFLLAVAAPSFFLGFDQTTQTRVLPGYFTRCYPISYYLIGAYFRDYPPKRTAANKMYIAAIFIVSLTWLSTTTYKQSLANAENEFRMVSWHYNDYGTWPVGICSAMIFLLFFDITCSNKTVNKILSTVSNATFACYLVSYVYDSKFYQTFTGKYLTVQERFQPGNAIVQILKIFACSMVTGLVLQGVYSFCEKKIKAAIAAQAERKAIAAANPAPEAAAETPAASEAETAEQKIDE